MIGLPPGGTVGVKPAQLRDRPKPRARKLNPAEARKIAWAEQIADEPRMLMGRGPDGRFFSLKREGKK
jgi:hypothetical protein